MEKTAYKKLTVRFDKAKNYRLLGRALQTKGGVILDWSADGVEFQLDCAGTIALTVFVSEENPKYMARFRVIVDDEPGEAAFVRKGTHTLTYFRGIRPGVHTVRILKDSAVSGRETRLISMTVTAVPGSMQPTKPKKKLLEVIGDSISCGYGVDGDPTSPTTSNSAVAIQTFGYRAAEALGMDYALVVKGSIGFAKKTGHKDRPKYKMEEIYAYQNRYRDAKKRYNFPRKADLIILALGANDGGLPPEEVEPAARSLIRYLREINGRKTPILLMYGMMSPTIEWLDQKLGAEIPDAYVLKVPQNRFGAGHHPNVWGQDRFTEEVLAAIERYKLV